jgi:hypothetical protein
VTIDRRAGRLLVTMNRDERWTRASEAGPVVHPAEEGRREWIAPVDGERGGTWIGANADGVVACLLNAYADGDLELLGRPDIPSRGEIVPALLGHGPDGVFRFMERDLDPTRFPSFIVVVVTPDDGRVLRWTLGSGVEHEPVSEGWSLITSSWWRAAEVEAWRRRRFADWIGSGSPFDGPLPAFNLLEEPDEREYSPLMTRSYSGTRSVTRVSVDRERSEIEMRYWVREGNRRIDPSRPSAEIRIQPAP